VIVQWKEVLDLLARHPRLWIPVAIPALWFAMASGRRMFESWDGFLEVMRYKFQPGLLSMMRGEFWEDVKAEFKLFIWGMMCLLMTLGLKIGLTKLVVMFSLVERFRLPV
jgi:hypothetical protein